jgi:hypothetical protein
VTLALALLAVAVLAAVAAGMSLLAATAPRPPTYTPPVRARWERVETVTDPTGATASRTERLEVEGHHAARLLAVRALPPHQP